MSEKESPESVANGGIFVRFTGLEGNRSAEWAARRLAAQLERREIGVRMAADSRDDGVAQEGCIVIAAELFRSPAGRPALAASESFVLDGTEADGRTTITISASGERGLIYGLLELADRVSCAADPLQPLRALERSADQPANEVRGICRMFVSREEDLPWFRDEAFWDDYLSELADHRFNRFHLAFGMGYDYGHDRDIRDNYLYFAYPFLLDVPGYEATVEGLADGEAARNLAALRRIGEQAKLRGLDFHVGLWNNAYDLPDSPNPRYTVRGLDKRSHAAYCRDALALLLRECPQIDGLTLRVHYESGIPEPAHEFWRTALSGIASCGREIRIDIHSKGVDADMIRMVRECSRMPVTVSPKFWAEHLGLPYHQASIREREMPESIIESSKFAVVTAGSRKATRYGYADFMKEDRDYGIFFRMWPGTQKFLLWGDPVMAAEYGRAASFCGSKGMELFEPLAFKGRKSSGAVGGRELYKDRPLCLGMRDWMKYAYGYRLWGRLLYNPDADPSSWRRYLACEYGAAAASVEAALGTASRILPLVTVVHHPSSANVDYWPELYTNLAVAPTKPSHLDYDLPEPKTFGAASPLDPQLFESVAEYADHVAGGHRSGKITPARSACTLERWAEEAEQSLAQAETLVPDSASPPFRRLAADVLIQAGLGRFFAHKLRAGIGYELFQRTGDPETLDASIRSYEKARDVWAGIAHGAGKVYRGDLAFGNKPHMRGHWKDRLPGIEEDIAELKRIRGRLKAPSPSLAPFLPAEGAPALSAAPEPSASGRDRPSFRIVSPASYKRGEPAEIAIEIAAAPVILDVRLRYRHLNQAERYETMVMARSGSAFSAVIPAKYTESEYAIIYDMIVTAGDDAWLIPGFGPDMIGQPYMILRQSRSDL